jgi:chromosome segregation ATPase
MSSDYSAVGHSPVSGGTSQHEAIKDFFDTLRNLASKKSFGEVEQLIAENSSLRLDVKSQGDENERLKSEIETLKVNSKNKVKELSDSHEQDYHRLFKINHESVAKEELEKTNLQTKLSAIQTELKEERRGKAEIQKHSQDLKQRNADYAAQHTEEIEKAAKAEKNLQELRTTLRGKEEQIKKNKEEIRKQELYISSLKSSLQTLEDEKKLITAQRMESERKLQQIHSFTQNLFDDDLAEA